MRNESCTDLRRHTGITQELVVASSIVVLIHKHRLDWEEFVHAIKSSIDDNVETGMSCDTIERRENYCQAVLQLRE